MDFEKWNPKDYLKQYYETKEIAEDEIHILKFCVDFFKSGAYHFSESIEIGSGPTIHHAIPLVPYVDNIYLSDYLDSNLSEIKKWINRDTKHHDWSPYLKGVLKIEGKEATNLEVEERTDLLRQRIKGLLHCDIFLSHPLDMNKKFPLVTSFYCADSATHSKEAWILAMQNILNLVAPKGWFIMSALEKAKNYKVGDLEFPSAQISGLDVEKVLKNSGFKPDSIVIKVIPISAWKNEGFDGIIIARAQKDRLSNYV